MTNIDLYKQCLASVRKQGVGTLTPETFVLWINRAQDIVVGNKLAGMDINARHRDDLAPLLELDKSVTIVDNVGSLPVKAKRSAYQAPSTRRCYYTIYSNEIGNVIAITAPIGYDITCKIDYYRNPIAITMDNVVTPVNLKWGNDIINEIVSEFTLLYLAHVGDQRLQHSIAVKQQTNTTN